MGPGVAGGKDGDDGAVNAAVATYPKTDSYQGGKVRSTGIHLGGFSALGEVMTLLLTLVGEEIPTTTKTQPGPLTLTLTLQRRPQWRVPPVSRRRALPLQYPEKGEKKLVEIEGYFENLEVYCGMAFDRKEDVTPP